MEQMTLDAYLKRKMYNRDGTTDEAPEWTRDERCGNCKYWQLLDKDAQPPCGWGVKGLCGEHRSQNRLRTDQFSWCQMYEYKG